MIIVQKKIVKSQSLRHFLDRDTNFPPFLDRDTNLPPFQVLTCEREIMQISLFANIMHIALYISFFQTLESKFLEHPGITLSNVLNISNIHRQFLRIISGPHIAGSHILNHIL